MKKDINTLARLLSERRNLWPKTLKDATKKQYHSSANASVHLIHDAYIIAVGSLLVDNDVDAYVSHVNIILQTFFKLHARQASGEVLIEINNWPSHHKYIFYALAINDIQSACDISRLCDPDKLVPVDSHPFNVEFTQALRLTVLGEPEAGEWVEKFVVRCSAKSSTIYRGYADALKSIYDGNADNLVTSLDSIVESYPKQASGSEYFQSVEKALLCYYGVGLVHLARAKGMDVEYNHPLTPRTLTALPLHTYIPPQEKKGLFGSLFK